MHQIITISGDPGSGKSTIAQKLAKKLKAKRIYVGEIRRKLAQKRGLTLDQLNKYAETHPETDVNIDKKVAKEARRLAKKHPVIVEGRIQFYFIPESFKIYIKVRLEKGAKRIWRQYQKKETLARQTEAKYNSLADVKKEIKNRIASDKKRYKKYYGLDHTKKSHYDFILDTTNLTPKQQFTKIWQEIKSLTSRSRAAGLDEKNKIS